MAEKGAGNPSGERVGGIYYEVTLDTSKLIAEQRQVDAAVSGTAKSLEQAGTAAQKFGKDMGGGLTDVAKAAKAAAHETALASREAKEFEAQAKALGMSVGQLKAATRGLPAQFTDIATSLASGQNPLTVFLQQGGQLKDMFGGVTPAFKALAGYVAGLANPFTVAAAAAGVLIYGLVKGGQEMQDFTRSLELTGNRAGVTADGLMGLAKAMDDVAGVTQAKAAEALNTFVALGIKGSDGLQKFTLAAIELERVGGPAVAETAQAFRDLEKDPLAASLKLQEATGFLTEEVYKQIKALEESGNKTEAARVAMDAYANAINERTPKIAEQLGLVERLWQGITKAAKEAGDEILNIGRATPKQEQLEALKNEREGRKRLTLGLAPVDDVDREIAVLEDAIKEEQRLLRLDQARRKSADGAIAADKARAQWADRYASNQERARKEIEQARKDGVLTPELERRINERYKDKTTKARKTRFSPEAYLADLQGKAAPTDASRANAEASEALERNRKMLADGLLTKQQAAQAEVLIEQRKQAALAAAAEKSTAQTEALRIAIMRDGEEKIKAIRAESLRKIEQQEKAGALTAEQAQLSRQKVEQDAQRSRADLLERDARAQAQARIAIITDEEAKIIAIRDEAIRQAQAGYQRGTLTAAEEAAKRVEAERAAQAQIEQLRARREAAQVQTLQIKASTPGATSEDKIALLKAQADLEFQAVEEARQRDLAAAQIYADQRRAIEEKLAADIEAVKQAERLAIVTSSEQAFSSVAEILKRAGKEQSTAYKVMFAASKAFAIASAIVNIQKGLSEAAALPFPANLAAMASVAASTASIVSTIASVKYGGGRQYGGPVSDDKMYRINETGRPEMFTAANGRQYMLPNSRGEVTPANEVGGGKVQIHVEVINNHPGAGVSVRQDDSGRVVQIAINEVASQISSNSGPVWQAMRGATNIEGRI